MDAGRYRSRVRHAAVERLNEEWSKNDGAVTRGNRRPKSAMHTLSERNWRVKRYTPNEVVAIEPGRDFETPFFGRNAFWEAVQFAAAELREHADSDNA